MVRNKPSRASLISSTNLLAVLVFCAYVPPLSAQTQEIPEISTERMTIFVEAHINITELRDDFHAEIARTHEPQERDRMRTSFQEGSAEILADKQMGQVEYDEITLVISIDEEQRSVFEQLLEELSNNQMPG